MERERRRGITSKSEDNNNNNNTKEKTEPITFRLKTSLIDELRNEAKEEGMNLNALVHRALIQYIWCNTPSTKGMMVPTSKSRFKAIMEELTEEQIMKVSQANDKTDPKSLQFILHGEYSEESLIESLEIWSIASRFDFSKRLEDGAEKNEKRGIQLMVSHNMGYKCSVFFCMTIVKAIENASGEQPKYNISENYFALTVDSPGAKSILQFPFQQKQKRQQEQHIIKKRNKEEER
jgi:hypothetical protein